MKNCVGVPLVLLLLLSVLLSGAGLLAASDQAGVGSPADAKAQPWTAREVRLIDRPDEVVAVLENGMVAIVKENHTAPVVSVRMYVRAGSIYEQNHLGAGLSHLFEHLLAGGATTERTEDESRELIEQIGARYNANTGKARTCYYLTVPARHVATALNLVAGWVTRPTFPQDAFDREWGVVQRELEMGASDPGRRLWKLSDEVRYTIHPGRYPVIGHQAIVQQLTREDILAYYRRMYVPDNTIIAVVGHINAQEMLAAIKKEFADFTRRGRVDIVLQEEPPVTAPRRVVEVFPAMHGPARLIIAFPSFKLQHEDLYALDTLANIMGSGRSSRLYRRLREEQQLVLDINAGSYTPHWAAGSFMINCALSPDNVAAAEASVLEVIELIAAEGVTEKELDRAKRQLLVGHIRSHQTVEAQAATMAEDYLATGDAHFSDHYVENMQKVTAADVKAMADKYLERSRQLTVVLTPTALPDDRADVAASAGQSPIRKITLDNGLRVLLKQNPSVPLVNIQLYVMGGLLEETQQNNGVTNLMVRLSKKGTANYSSEQITDYFDSIGGVLQTGCGNNTFFYSAEVMADDFAGAFKVYSEVVLSPTYPEDELSKLREQVLAGIAQENDSWHAAATRFFRASFFDQSPYSRMRTGTAESVERITREEIAAFHQSNVAGSRAVLTVFGDIDLAEVQNLVQERFAAMPKGQEFDLTRFKEDTHGTGSVPFIQETTKKGAVVYVGFPGMQLSNVEDRYPMGVMEQVVGSNTGWLHEGLRGRQLVYYAWGINFAGLLPGYVAATAQCESDKVGEVITVIDEFLDKARRGEFTEKEIARAKSKRINAEVLDKQTNADAAMTAALDELYGFGYDWSEGNADRIMAVTINDVKRVAAKYLAGAKATAVLTSDPTVVEAAPKPSTPAGSTSTPKTTPAVPADSG